jgi:mxaD protein
MTVIIETVKVAEEPDKLWTEMGMFGAIGEWHPMLTKVGSQGEREGCLRMAEAQDGSRQIDRLVEMAPEQHFYRYCTVRTDMPVHGCVREIRVRDNGDRTSTVVWAMD